MSRRPEPRPSKEPRSRLRCSWPRNPLAIRYHDKEWGVPVRNDRKLFEFLILEGAQAGLSWDTVLAKRENYREALDGFDFERIAAYGPKKKKALLANPGIVRNRAKIESTVVNARGFIALRKEFGSFSRYVWRFTDAAALSKDLKKRGFNFVGPTIMYAFMQATGMVNDHQKACFRYKELKR
jgi:DNA-3-methyladenine glycosylase I